MANTSEMPTSSALVQAAGAGALTLDMSTSIDVTQNNSQLTANDSQHIAQLPISPQCATQPAPSPTKVFPVSPANGKATLAFLSRSPQSPYPHPQSPTVAFAPLMSPGAAIRSNATNFGIPLNMATAAGGVPVPVRANNGIVVAPSPTNRVGPSTHFVLSSPTAARASAAPQQVVSRTNAESVQSPVQHSPVTFASAMSPTMSPTSALGAEIRNNAMGFGIPLNLANSPAAVPVPIRTVSGAVVAPSPMNNGVVQQLTFGMPSPTTATTTTTTTGGRVTAVAPTLVQRRNDQQQLIRAIVTPLRAGAVRGGA